ncbi:MAG: cytochrome c biogenesis heme-transporting ATPase CcmA [Gammaproteobacteria bacterium]|nr:cytochrome c biogenesis heme-transporting ATPase CcmA [Gammaproteobacteria bacterium]NNJ48809.1 cytochrome c biogenesis heme-transporting ATPase CcmA [Gammaproteobacteria bacterium]
MFEAKSLECVRDDRLLFNDLSFAVAESEVLQIEGANGSGKTSLLRILCGLRLPEAGQVLWQEESIISNREDYYASMVYIGHLPCVKGDLTVLENVRSLLDTRSLSLSNEQIEVALAKVGLASYEDVPGKALSSGQRRRILLAFIELSQAKLWILDEPLTALDVQGVTLMESMIMEHKQAGGSVVFTTHHGMQLECEMSSVQLGRRSRG